jgi:Cu+-exporting ATPase
MTNISFIVNPPKETFNPSHLTRVLHQVSGVSAVRVEQDVARVTVTYNPKKVDTFMLVSAVQDAGYSVATESVTLFVTGMTCTGCVFHTESALTDIPGVIDVEVDLQSGRTIVNVVTGSVELNTLYQAVENAGYRVKEPVPGH